MSYNTTNRGYLSQVDTPSRVFAPRVAHAPLRAASPLLATHGSSRDAARQPTSAETRSISDSLDHYTHGRRNTPESRLGLRAATHHIGCGSLRRYAYGSAGGEVSDRV